MTIFFIASIILLLVGVPISVSIGASAILECLVLDHPLMIIGQEMVTGVDSYLLIVTPLFILAGNLMNTGKVTDRIFSSIKGLMGWIPDSLGHANTATNIIFAGMSGSAVADVSGLGTIEAEVITKNGYRDNFSGMVTAASLVIGPMSLPSIPLIIYGATASINVAKLFMGSVLSGLLMGVAPMVLVFIFTVKYRFERHPFDIIALSKQFLSSILFLITPLIILAGFTFGSFTPMEASGVAVAYSLVIAVVVCRTIDWEAFKNCLLGPAITSANTLFIIGISTLLTYMLARGGAFKAIVGFILGISNDPEVILLIINVVLLILGMFMEPRAILALMLPVLLSIVEDLSINLIHSGVVMALNLMIGRITLPFGVYLFVMSDVARIELDKLYRSIMPFLAPSIIVLLMCTYTPDIVVWPSNLLVK